MIEPFMWNLFVLGLVTIAAGLFGKEGERWLSMQVVFYLGLFFTLGFWTLVLVVKVAMAT